VSTTAPATTTSAAPVTTTTVPVVATGELPEPEGFHGITGWRLLDLAALNETFRAEVASPQAKIDALVAMFLAEPSEGRTETRGVVTSVQSNRAQVVVRVIGVADDSIGGHEHRVYLLQERPGEMWKVVSIEVRDFCSRAIDGDLCV
jgi:hypothetical protein